MTNRIVFIDARIANYQALIAGLPVGAAFVVLDTARDALQQIAEALQGKTNLDAIDIVSHGAPGTLHLGNSILDNTTITAYKTQLAEIGRHLSASGDILLYGSDVAVGAAGQAFIKRVAQLTGADVAASTNLTGQFGFYRVFGDWSLEAHSGEIEAPGLPGTGFRGILSLNTSTKGNDSLYTEDPITLHGDEGNDTLYGYHDSNISNEGFPITLYGDVGDDTLIGVDGSHILVGGEGNDNLSCWGGYDWKSDVSAEGGAGDDTLYGSDIYRGSLRGGDGNDSITLSLGSPSDFYGHVDIEGGAGNDVISVYGMNDTFSLSGIAPTLATVATGPGSDQIGFSYVSPYPPFPLFPTNIKVTDFTAGVGKDFDQVNLEGILASLVNWDGTANPFGAGFLRLVQQGADTHLQWDKDGKTGSAGWKTQIIFQKTTASAFTADNFLPAYKLNGSLPPGITLTGTNGNDKLTGTLAKDVIDARGGDDRVDGKAGSDVINGGAGNDTLAGGLGHDVLQGGDGKDNLQGGTGNDLLYGDVGDDALSDIQGSNKLYGGAGNDILQGGAGNDQLYGDAGNDTLSDTQGSNKLYGGAGNDLLQGGAGSGHLYGDAGNDTLSVSGGSNTLSGGAGNDTLIASGYGNPIIYGGDGNDSITLNDYAHANFINAGAGNDLIRLGVGASVGQITTAVGSDRINFAPQGQVFIVTDFTAGSGKDFDKIGAVINPLSANASLLRVVQNGADTHLQVDWDGKAGSGGWATQAILQKTTASALTAANFSTAYVPGFITNHAPTLTVSANSITENTRIGTGIKVGVLILTDPDANDVNNNALSLSGTDASLFQIRSNELFYTGASPNFEAKSRYTLTVTATDYHLTYKQNVTINVIDVNDAPTVKNKTLTLREDTVLDSKVMATDDEADALTYTLAQKPQHGTISFHKDGNFRYTPAKNYYGKDTFSFKANDGHSDSKAAVVNLVVKPVNDAPVFMATDHTLTVISNAGANKAVTFGEIRLASYFSDVDNGTLGVRQLKPASSLNATSHNSHPNDATAKGTITLVDDNKLGGSFQMSATDGVASSGTVTVTYANQPALTHVLTAAPSGDSIIVNAQAFAARLTGGKGNDYLLGNTGSDLLTGAAGDDRLDGGGGTDVLNGGDGNDILRGYGKLYGGEGNDSLYGSGSDNTLLDGKGNDLLVGGGGNDRLHGNGKLYGGEGNDRLYGVGGDNTLVGGEGSDLLSGSGKLYGGEGNDVLRGGGNLYGDMGNDRLYGYSREDTLAGGEGNDVLTGGGKLYGGEGNDILNGAGDSLGASGNDILSGGPGKDVFVFNTPFSTADFYTLTDFVSGIDTLQLSPRVFTAFYGSATVGIIDSSLASGGHHLIYETATHTLYYDANGGSHANAVKIAIIGSGSVPVAADFKIIA